MFGAWSLCLKGQYVTLHVRNRTSVCTWRCEKVRDCVCGNDCKHRPSPADSRTVLTTLHPCQFLVQACALTLHGPNFRLHHVHCPTCIVQLQVRCKSPRLCGDIFRPHVPVCQLQHQNQDCASLRKHEQQCDALWRRCWWCLLAHNSYCHHIWR